MGGSSQVKEEEGQISIKWRKKRQKPMPPVNCHYGLWIYSKPKYGPQIWSQKWSQKSTNLIHQYHTEWRLYHPPFSYIHSLSHSIYLSVCRHILSMDIMTAHCLCVYCILVDRWCSTFPHFVGGALFHCLFVSIPFVCSLRLFRPSFSLCIF